MIPPIRLHAAYHQVYLFDDGVCQPAPENITNGDLQNRIKAVPNLLAIYTASDREVEIQIEVTASRSSLNESHWLHIVEAPLAVPSGQLVVANPESYLAECARVPVPAGAYQVRVAARGFRDTEREEYFVSMWPGTTRSVSVIKSAGAYAA